MQLYNTLTRKKEEFVPVRPGKVNMYVCGITAYDYCHIGHARSALVFDVLVRHLRALGLDVTFVRNFTDVDDKIIRRANEEKRDWREVGQTYIDAFHEDMDRLNVVRADHEPRATEYIQQMQDLCSELIAQGKAYAVPSGDVYFRVRAYPPYGKLSGRSLDELQAGARVAPGEEKQDPLDFALWKAAKPGEPFWESPWGKGRPGWHIECSGISMKYNGEYLDLHCGGIDNAFPHHTNEIAQSESYLGHPWCPQWFHVAHLNTSHGKMSKSKGEFLTVSLLEEKGYDPLSYRFFCLQSHYRKALVFSWENLDNAAAAYGKLIAKIAALNPEDGAVDEAVLKEYKEKFLQQMGNDLNTSMGVTALYDALKAKTNDATKLAILNSYDQVLSLSLLEKAAAVREANAKAQTAKAEGGYTVTGEGDPAIDALVMQRYEAKKSKNFAEADRIRDELKAQGIEIVDTKDGANWKRV